jgi:hypothetical protein
MNSTSLERFPRRLTHTSRLSVLAITGFFATGTLGCDRSVVTEEAEPTPSDAAKFGPEPHNDATTRVGGQTTGTAATGTSDNATTPTAETSAATSPSTGTSANETGATPPAATTTQ